MIILRKLIPILLIVFQGCFINDAFRMTDKLLINPTIPVIYKIMDIWLDKSKKDISDFKPITDNLGDYMDFVINNLEYEKDDLFNDNIPHPNTFLKEGKNDCDGFAILAYANFGEVIRHNGKEYHFEAFYGLIRSLKGHIVCRM